MLRKILASVYERCAAPKMTPRRLLTIESMELRDVPATLISATTLTYRDVDGDNVTVKFSKPILTAANASTIFTFDTAFAAATGQQLQSINLASVAATATGTTVFTTASRSTTNGGDGFAALGQIDATGIDLGAVNVDGDLGRIVVGNAITTTPGLASLTVASLGRFGTNTGAANLDTVVQGKLGVLTVKGDVKNAFVTAQGGPDGKIGPVTIGGSLIGGAAANAGRISASGDIGRITIKGSMIGDSGQASGQIGTAGSIASVTIGGDLKGADGVNSGQLVSQGAIGSVRITGDVIGGSNIGTGYVGGNSFASVTIGGNFLGGSSAFSGHITSNGAIGAVRIAGDVIGGSGSGSGQLKSLSNLASVTIGGNLQGGTADFSGTIIATGSLAYLRVVGDIVGGSASAGDLMKSGYVEAQRISVLSVGGSLISGTDTTVGSFNNNGAIRVDDDIASITVGNIIGNPTNPFEISARGKANPTATRDVAIGSLRVLGRVEYADIIAGVDVDGLAKNADAQINAVTVSGDWIASSLVAGAIPGNGFYGDAGDAKMSGAGVKDNITLSSKITSLTIAGQANGDFAGIGSNGIVAENIGTVRVGGTLIPTTAGNGNDDFALGITGDFKIIEI